MITDILVCHPESLELLRQKITDNSTHELRLGPLAAVEIRTNRYMPKDEPTGFYLLPDGTRVKKDSFVWRTPFVQYGPEDISYLLYAGLIKEQRTPVFYVMKRNALPTNFFDVR